MTKILLRILFCVCIVIILGIAVESIFIYPKTLTNADGLWSRIFVMLAAGLIARAASKRLAR
jgi:hypothetical protein